MIVSFILLIALTVIISDEKWIVFVGGVLGVLFGHAVWGLFIEMARNIIFYLKK